jgi:hypothetical protein
MMPAAVAAAAAARDVVDRVVVGDGDDIQPFFFGLGDDPGGRAGLVLHVVAAAITVDVEVGATEVCAAREPQNLVFHCGVQQQKSATIASAGGIVESVLLPQKQRPGARLIRPLPLRATPCSLNGLGRGGYQVASTCCSPTCFQMTDVRKTRFDGGRMARPKRFELLTF